jgi:nitrogenase molybdenum-iron protein alpha chain
MSTPLTFEPIDLQANTCPSREQRANGINVYFGKASQLVHDAREGKLRNCEREFQQTSGCVLNFYLTVRVPTIRDAVTIFHDPVRARRPC